MIRKQKAVTHGLPYSAELNNRIEAATKQGGFSSRSAFIRAAIERELAGRESGVDAAERRIAASLDRMAREIHNSRIGQQALFAFVDVLAKTFLTCVPEPPRDVHDQAVARGKARYDRLLKSVGMAMVGDSQGRHGRAVRPWPRKVKASEGCEIGRGASNIAGERSICLVARYEHAPSIRLKLSAPAKGQFARDLGRRSAGVQPTLCRSRDVLAKLDHPALRMP